MDVTLNVKLKKELIVEVFQVSVLFVVMEYIMKKSHVIINQIHH